MVLALAGVALAGAGMFVPALAPFQVHSCTLIVGGVLFFGVGALRRSLAGIRSTVDCVSNETLRLEQLSIDNQGLKSSVQEVGSVASALRGDLSSLHEQVQKLVAITSDSDFQTSIFQLAASLDQVGARLDIGMKERFQVLEQNLSKMGEKRDQASEGLSAKLQEVGDALKEQEQMFQLVQEEYAQKLQSASVETQEHISRSMQSLERLERELEQHQLSVAEGFQGLSDGAHEHASRTAAGLDEVRTQIAQHVDAQSGSLHERLDGVEARFTKVDREHAAAMGQLAERLEREISAGSQAIQASLQSIEQLADHGDDAAARELENTVREQLAALRSVVEEAARAAADSDSRVSEGVELLGERIEEVFSGRFDALSDGLAAVVECASETAESVHKLLEEPEHEPLEHEPLEQEHEHELRGTLSDDAASFEAEAEDEVAVDPLEDAEPAAPMDFDAPQVEQPMGYEPPMPRQEPVSFEPQVEESEQAFQEPEPSRQEWPQPQLGDTHFRPLPEPQVSGPEPLPAPMSSPAPEPPSALPQQQQPGEVEDPWAPPPQTARETPYPQARPDHDPLADPFGRYGDGSRQG
jgi:hypothetical protein